MLTEYELICSNRCTISVEINGGKVIVRAPLRMSKTEIEQFVTSKADWISKHLEAAKQRQSVPVQPFTAAEISSWLMRHCRTSVRGYASMPRSSA